MSPPSPRSPASKPKPAEEASFEETVARLTTIVKELESTTLPLEKSLELFEEGVRLSRASQQKLAAAEKRVNELLGIDRDGTARTVPFQTTAETGPSEEEEEPDLDDTPF